MLDILDPTLSSEAEPIAYAPRPAGLDGLRIGVVENTRRNSETLLRKIAGHFAEKHGARLVHLIHKHQRAPIHEADLADFKAKTDVVLCGIGDCGGCSSGSVLDAILLEKAGVPAVSIITDAFRETGREMARLWGVPDFRFVEMPHPLGSLSEADLDRRAEELVTPVAALLKQGQPAAKAPEAAE